MADRLDTIARWLQQEDEAVLYAPDGEPCGISHELEPLCGVRSSSPMDTLRRPFRPPFVFDRAALLAGIEDVRRSRPPDMEVGVDLGVSQGDETVLLSARRFMDEWWTIIHMRHRPHGDRA